MLETVKPVAPNEQNSEEGGNQGRKRGRRGGRRERERRDQIAGTPPNGNEIVVNEVITNELSTHNVNHSPESIPPVATEVESQHHVAASTPVEPTFTPTTVASEIVVTPVSIVTEPVISEPIVTTAPTPVAEFVPVNDSTQPAPTSIIPSLSEVGLVMIETDPNKAATVAPVPEVRDHAPRRRQRPREIYTAENNEPLVMIETQHPQ